MEFTLRPPPPRTAFPGLALGEPGIVIHAYAHVGPLDAAAGFVDEVRELQDRRVGSAFAHAENKITVPGHRGTVTALELRGIAREPAEADVVALVETHERSEAARPGAPGNDS